MKAKNLKILQENGFPVPKFKLVYPEEEIDFSDFNSDIFAIRSNDECEDGEKLSYAGQFLTKLNVGKDGVKKAVKEVANSYKKRDYEKIFGIKEKKISTGVIVQEMIEADYSGILFTSNPKGILNDSVIVVGKGLGSQIVEDKKDVITYHHYKNSITYKEGKLFDFPEIFLKKLILLGGKIENLFKEPMDIEFAIRKDKIFVLQARKITSLDFSLPYRILDNSNIAESYPGVCAKLTRSFALEIYTKIFQRLGKRVLGKKACNYNDIFSHMVSDFGGRMYYEISSWYDILRLLPFSSKIIPIWQKMLGVEDKKITFSKEKPRELIKLRILLTVAYLLVFSQRKMKNLSVFFKKAFDYFDKKIEKEDNPQRLYQIFKEMEKLFFREWDLTLVNDMVSFLSTDFAGTEFKKSLLLESGKPALALEDLTKAYLKSDLKEYQKKKNNYIKVYGDRTIGELKLETRTFRTNPELLDELVKERAAHVPVRNRASKTKGVRIPFLYHLARLSTNYREISRLNRSRIFGLMRKLIDKIGNRTVGEDIYHLSLSQIKEMVFSGKNFKEEIEEEKTLMLIYKQIPTIPRVELLGNPKIDFSGIDASFEDMGKKKDIFIGRGVSKGKLKGKVIKITDVSKVSPMDVKDKIIATYSTDPGWFLLLDMAKGILAQRGSLLSHTAIVARELKKPAVVGIANLMERVEDGDIVELDGNKGICKITRRIVKNE